MSPAQSSGTATKLSNVTASCSIPLVALAPHPVFGHQGGWDEFLLVAAPLGVIALLLWLANKRVSAKLEEANTQAGGNTGESDQTGRS